MECGDEAAEDHKYKINNLSVIDLTVYTVKYGKSNSNNRIHSMDQLVMTWQYNG